MDPTTANELMTKKSVGKLIDIVYRNCGSKATVIFCDRVMALGFRGLLKLAFRSASDDRSVPKAKDKRGRRHPQPPERGRTSVR